MADAGLTISREGTDSQVTCWKARFPWIGKIGVAEMSFDVDTGRFDASAWGDLDGEGWDDF